MISVPMGRLLNFYVNQDWRKEVLEIDIYKFVCEKLVVTKFGIAECSGLSVYGYLAEETVI